MPPGMETMMNNANKKDDGTEGLKAEIADLKQQMAQDKMDAQMAKLTEKLESVTQENAVLKDQLAQATGGNNIGDRAMPGHTHVGQPVSFGSSAHHNNGVASIGSAGRVGGSSPFSGTGTKV